MAIRPFLAMTAAEIRNTDILPSKIAWMACHFSPYGKGLSNLPAALPEGSLLIVDDITPIRGHDPEVITCQLIQCLDTLRPYGVLLDFQRPDNPEIPELIHYLSQALPCPLAVSDTYGSIHSLPVFLPPVPPSVPLQEQLSGWKGREIWLDISTWGETRILTEEGCSASLLSPPEFPEAGFKDELLHCHYKAEKAPQNVRFCLWRTAEDLSALLEEAEQAGTVQAVGLYQEFKPQKEIQAGTGSGL